MIKGRAPVSTDGQTIDAQHSALGKAGATQCSPRSNQGQRRGCVGRCSAALEPGNTPLLPKLDRLARSTRDLLNTLAAIVEAGASFKSLGEPWADTTAPHGRLMPTVLGGLAEFERHLIISRTAEDRSRAKDRGVSFGRRPRLTKHQQAKALVRRAAAETPAEIARSTTSRT
jgi:DNA invertase Pin-like site-specific DNA recombinase